MNLRKNHYLTILVGLIVASNDTGAADFKTARIETTMRIVDGITREQTITNFELPDGVVIRKEVEINLPVEEREL